MNKYAHLAPRKVPIERRRCATKVRYPTGEAAAAGAEKAGARLGAGLHPYRCAMCLGWHTTSKAPR